jgi:hypothetical protein
MMGVFAEFERSIIQERIRAGMARARSEGKHLGRPRIEPKLEERIRAAVDKLGRTEGVRKIAARFGVAASTVQNLTRPFAPAGASAASKNKDCFPRRRDRGGKQSTKPRPVSLTRLRRPPTRCPGELSTPPVQMIPLFRRIVPQQRPNSMPNV